MTKRFSISIGEAHAVAELLEEDAPGISRHLWDNLPMDSFGVHAKFAGQELIVMVPFYAEPENEILNVHPGDIGYYPGRQTICLFYGDTTPFGYVSVFARIVDSLDELQPAGEQVLNEGLLPAKLERMEDNER